MDSACPGNDTCTRQGDAVHAGRTVIDGDRCPPLGTVTDERRMTFGAASAAGAGHDVGVPEGRALVVGDRERQMHRCPRRDTVVGRLPASRNDSAVDWVGCRTKERAHW